MWTIIIPAISLIGSVMCSDRPNLYCYPIFIANIIFGFMMVGMSIVMIVYIVQIAHLETIQIVQQVNIGALMLGYLLQQIYVLFMDKRDLLKEKESEDKAEAQIKWH